MTSTFIKCAILATLAGAVGAAAGCTGDGEESDTSDGSATDGGPDTSVCVSYCSNVMNCADGWGGGNQQYVSESMCVAECAGFIEGGGGCGSAASDYFSCAGGIDDCDDYSTLHDAQCAALETGFEGWCL